MASKPFFHTYLLHHFKKNPERSLLLFILEKNLNFQVHTIDKKSLLFSSHRLQPQYKQCFLDQYIYFQEQLWHSELAETELQFSTFQVTPIKLGFREEIRKCVRLLIHLNCAETRNHISKCAMVKIFTLINLKACENRRKMPRNTTDKATSLACMSSQATRYLWQATCSLTFYMLGGKFSAAIARYHSSYTEMLFTEAAPFILLFWSAAV